MGEQQRFGIIGSPVLHSKSPLMFNTYFEQKGIDATYTRIASQTAADGIKIAQNLGFSGLNVTAPFKQDVIPLLDYIDPAAKAINGVNTILFNDGKLSGYNTDYLGVINPFKGRGISFTGKRIAILGAGGAGRAALYGVSQERCTVMLFNRTYEKAVTVAEPFNAIPYPLEQLKDKIHNIDIIISTLSSHHIPIPKDLIQPKHVVFDANYKTSPLIQAAKEAGATVIRGIEWLLHQAIPAGAYFLGTKPDIQIMGQALKDAPKDYPHRGNFALIGFMGAGKSRIGQALKNVLNLNLIDTDQMIRKRTNMSISEIFKCYGEDRFRAVERDMVSRALAGLNQLIACGGGVVVTPENRIALKKQALSIWLYASIDTILERIQDGSRPLLINATRRETEAMFKGRIPLYSSCADLIVSTEQPIDIITGIINDEINQTFNH